MKIALIGATGFVGGHITEALLTAKHDVAALVRPGSDGKIRQRSACELYHGSLEDKAVLTDLITGCDAVIYNVGLLREFPRKGITFEQTHYQGVVDTIALAQRADVSRYILMSANGVREGGTPYQDSKFRGEEALRNSGLDYTIFQPSVIFGDPHGKMEFATQLFNDMIRPPLPALAFHNGFSPERGVIEMTPVHVKDVADAFVAALSDPSVTNKTIPVGGPEALSFGSMLRRIAATTGKQKIISPLPLPLMRFTAQLLDWLPFFPVTGDQLQMLAEGNVAPAAALTTLIGRDPTPFDQNALSYLLKNAPKNN